MPVKIAPHLVIYQIRRVAVTRIMTTGIAKKYKGFNQYLKNTSLLYYKYKNVGVILCLFAIESRKTLPKAVLTNY